MESMLNPSFYFRRFSAWETPRVRYMPRYVIKMMQKLTDKLVIFCSAWEETWKIALCAELSISIVFSKLNDFIFSIISILDTASSCSMCTLKKNLRFHSWKFLLLWLGTVNMRKFIFFENVITWWENVIFYLAVAWPSHKKSIFEIVINFIKKIDSLKFFQNLGLTFFLSS